MEVNTMVGLMWRVLMLAWINPFPQPKTRQSSIAKIEPSKSDNSETL